MENIWYEERAWIREIIQQDRLVLHEVWQRIPKLPDTNALA